MKVKHIAVGGLIVLVAVVAAACRRSRSREDVAPPVESTATLIEKANGLYGQRDDLTKLRAGIAALKDARTRDFTNYDILWRLAKFNYYLASHSPNDDERDRAFHDGVEAGKAAVTAKPEGVDGHFWLGANYGGNAKTGILAGLSSIQDIRDEMEQVIKLDPNYEGGSAYLILGQVSLEAPKILGGDTTKAIEYLETGNKLDSSNPMIKVTLAEAYMKANRFAEARKSLDDLAKMKPDPDYLPEHKEALAAADDLRQKLDKKNRSRAD